MVLLLQHDVYGSGVLPCVAPGGAALGTAHGCHSFGVCTAWVCVDSVLLRASALCGGVRVCAASSSALHSVHRL